MNGLLDHGNLQRSATMRWDVETDVLICHLREARRKARVAATAEILSLLRDLDPTALPGGPLAERRGVFWVGLPVGQRAIAAARLSRLGYTSAVDVLEPLAAPPANEMRSPASSSTIRWRGRWFQAIRLYDEDPDAMRQRAVDRRTFLLEIGSGEVRPVQGYRGDSGPLRRRGLPVADADLLVNLVFQPARGRFLDPFAGTGGIVIEARAAGWRCTSADLDPALRFGLAALSEQHVVADATDLPFRSGSFDAIATEPPYDRQAMATVVRALQSIHRVLAPHGRVAILSAAWQAPVLRAAASRLGLCPYLDAPVDRKGTDVVALAWRVCNRRDGG